MGIGAARIYLAPASDARSRSLLLFLVQLVFNFFWSIIFFNLQAFGFAFLWLIALWVLILLMILSFRKVDKPAAWLQIPSALGDICSVSELRSVASQPVKKLK